MQLFNFQWLARSSAGSLLLLFTYGSRRQLFINQAFFEQLSPRFAVIRDCQPGGAQTLSQFFRMTQLPPAAFSSLHILAAFPADAKEPTRAR
jgi:hypothetical protein